jgi:DNA-binding NtrC family response regulator
VRRGFRADSLACTIEVPLPEVEEMGEQAERAMMCALIGVRVLVAEDEFPILAELESILTEAGAEIVGVCRTVKEALAVADMNSPGAAILDMRLDRGTVAPVARMLSKRGIPFVFYTGQAEIGLIRREWPKSKIITKPARPQTIVAAVVDSLRHQRGF